MKDNPSFSMDPQLMAAKEIVKGLKELKPVMNELLEQFGLSKESDFRGIPLIAALLYQPALEVKQGLHDLLVIEKQIMAYLDGLGADLSSAEKAVTNFFAGKDF